MLSTGGVHEWVDLVKEAQSDADICLAEELESYLVFLLMRFIRQPELAASVLGMEYLQAHHHGSHKNQLREVGDKCLLFSGLFPKNANKKRVSVGYFINLGRTAYHEASQQDARLAALFEQLSSHFVAMRDVLQQVGGRGHQALEADLLLAFELWEKESSLSKKVLSQRFHGFAFKNFSETHH